MLGANRLSSLAVALCLYHASAFAGIISTRGARSNAAARGARANTAMPPRALDGAEQQLGGPVRHARGGALFQSGGASAVSMPEGDLRSKKGGGGLLASYLRALDRKPIITKVITSGVICGVGDIMAQALAFKTKQTEAFTLGGFVSAIEPNRFIIYTVLGAAWIAPVVHFWFNALEATFQKKKEVTGGKPAQKESFGMKMLQALKMVSLDQTIGAPVVNAGFMFLFTFATALTTGAGLAGASQKGSNMLRNSLWGTMLVCWRLWPVANLINFAFVPANLRVLFMNFVGLGWNIYLSAAVN